MLSPSSVRPSVLRPSRYFYTPFLQCRVQDRTRGSLTGDSRIHLRWSLERETFQLLRHNDWVVEGGSIHSRRRKDREDRTGPERDRLTLGTQSL